MAHIVNRAPFWCLSVEVDGRLGGLAGAGHAFVAGLLNGLRQAPSRAQAQGRAREP